MDTTTTFFIFKVVIGRSYVRDRSNMDPQNRDNAMYPPEGYDSVYIVDDSIPANRQRQDDIQSKISHTYAIFSNEKVRLLYQVRVKIVLSQQPKHIFCTICLHNQGPTGSIEESKGANANLRSSTYLASLQQALQNVNRNQDAHGHHEPQLAKKYCVQDQAYFCDEHFKDFHDGDKHEAFKQHKIVVVQQNEIHRKFNELRRQPSRDHLVNIKDSLNKQQESVKTFNEDLVAGMFGLCERHPHMGYQYFDKETGRAMCILDITEEEQEHDLGTKDLSKRYCLINEVYEEYIKQIDEDDKDLNEKKRVINE